MTIQAREQQLIEDFDYFSSWEEKYEYLIEMSKDLAPLDEQYRQEIYLIPGCQARVWLHAEHKEGQVFFYADSDAIITKGLIALFVHLLSGAKAEEIADFSFDFLSKIGLEAHLSPTRANGLKNMVEQIRGYARAFASTKNQLVETKALDFLQKKALEEQIIAVLRTIFDPEIPVDIYALGLIYQIQIQDDATVTIEMTLTSPNCPVAESLPQDVKNKVETIEGLAQVQVNIVFEPAWHKDMMSDEAKLELGFL